MATNKRKRLTLGEKVEILRSYEKNNMTVRSCALQYQVGKTQISEILRAKSELLKAWSENGDQGSKRKFPKTSGSVIDALTYEWICRARAQNVPLSGPLIQEKALEIANQQGCADFKASSGWLGKFRKRHQIGYRVINGEAASVDANVVNDWNNVLQDTIAGYEPSDIYNLDETALFYRALPNKTMCLKGESVSGIKQSKNRLTVMLCVNMTGDFEKPLIIGHAKKPRCFNGVNMGALNIQWRHNKKAWMTRDIMSDFLLNFDNKMRLAKRKVLLFMDNAASHPRLELTNVKLCFFPPNTTSICQPLDQGIIKNFKVHYRRRVLKHLLKNINVQDQPSENISTNLVSVLDSIWWIIGAVKEITPETVGNCFKKCGFLKSSCLDSDPNNCNSEECAETELEQLLRPFGIENRDFVHIDDAEDTEETSLDVNAFAENLEDYSEPPAVEAENPILEHVTLKETVNCMSKIKAFCLRKGDDCGLEKFAELEAWLDNFCMNKETKQTSITDFFGKKL